VNLASRVQGTTKYLRVPAIVTGSTRRLVGDAFPARRLCSVRVVNIVEPVDLFELALEDGSERAGLFAAYEEALTAFDSGRFAAATKILGDLLAGAPADGPALVLLSRAVACMIDEPRDFSPVWTLPGK
jgi:adenylate cyclase